MLQYTTSPIPRRISELRSSLFAASTSVCYRRARIVTESYRHTEGEPWVVRRAQALCAVFDEMPLCIRDGELLVGQRASMLAGRSVYPEYNSTDVLVDGCPDDIRDYWKGRTLRDEVYAAFPEALIRAERELAAAYCTGSGSGFGHVIVDYGKVLSIGFSGVAAEISSRIEALESRPCDPQTMAERTFLDAALLTVEGVIRWARSHADLIESESHATEDPARRRELNAMAEICRRVPEHPPRTFHEALQSFWFTHLALHLEQYGWSISAGRFDQYMYPFFRADLDSGRATRDELWELVLSLWVKFMENVGTEVGKTVFQNLTLGGGDASGADESNELSRLCLEATVALRFHQPAITVRWHPNIDPDFWRRVNETIAQGLGLPAVFNDEVVIAALTGHGVPHEEAVGYGIVGCVEACVPGRQQGVTAGGHLNVAKALELALNEGVSMVTGEPIGEPTPPPESFESIDDLWDAYTRQVRYLGSLDVLASHIAGAVQKRRGHCPFMSSLLDDCIATGRDLVDGGTRHNLPGVSVFGNSNTYDGMASIRRLVCDEKTVSWAELREALTGDFVGFENLQRQLASGPRFGNDLGEVDDLANRINEVHAEFFWSHTDARGGRYTCGVWPVEGHVHTGRWTGATPDGRRQGAPLADGVGACHGADASGPTALLASVAKLDHARHWAAGNTCNIKFSTGVVGTERGPALLDSLISAYFAAGGQQLQVNVVDAATLKDAQEHPESHPDLIVRVAGFSAYFTRLGRDVQDEIISRTEQDVAV